MYQAERVAAVPPTDLHAVFRPLYSAKVQRACLLQRRRLTVHDLPCCWIATSLPTICRSLAIARPFADVKHREEPRKSEKLLDDTYYCWYWTHNPSCPSCARTVYSTATPAKTWGATYPPRSQSIIAVTAALPDTWLRERIEHVAVIDPLHPVF